MHMQRRMYHRYDGYDELKPMLDGSDGEILGAFDGKPVLIRIPAASTAASPRARLVSCLLHGNEPAGFRAMVEVLRRGERYPFDLWVLIGNVRAATEQGLFAHRHLDGQEDFNRVWDGGPAGPGASDTRRCAAAMLDELRSADLEAAVDIHNNTGRNPYYAVLPEPTPAARGLAALCADTVLLWRLRAHTLMEALATRCPAVAVECGSPDDADGVAFASGVVHRFLTADGFDVSRAAPRPPRLIETLHRVTVRPEVAFSFGRMDIPAGDGEGEKTELVIAAGLDAHNFGVLPARHTIGRVVSGRTGPSMPLQATDTSTGRDVTDDLFGVTADGRVVVLADLAPIMITTTVGQTRRDCLLYTIRPVD
jgi:hypothetical protein